MTRPRIVLAGLAAVLLVLAAGNLAAARYGPTWDLTAEGSATLSDGTRRVLDELDSPIRITAFFERDAIGRVEAATLLSRYRKANRLVSWRIVDPTLAPGEIDRLGVQQPGSAAVETMEGDKRIEIAQFAVEIDITSAIARLVRGVDATVCFTTGHGERSIGDDGPEGLEQAAGLLRDAGYTLRTIDLLASAAVPEACDAVVVADPTAMLSEDAVGSLVKSLASDGKAFVLTDPDSSVDPTPITEDWGISFRRGVVFEADEGSRLPNDPTSPIVRRYDTANPAVRGLGPTFFPGAQAVLTDAPPGRDGLSVSTVAVTSEAAYLETEPGSDFSVDEDLPGPVGVLAAADESEVRGAGTDEPEIRRTRILAASDVDFASNRFVEEASNARLVVQGVDWLTQPEPLLTAVPSFPTVRDLSLTEARSRYLLFLVAGVVPGLFLIAGGFVWVIRRGR